MNNVDSNPADLINHLNLLVKNRECSHFELMNTFIKPIYFHSSNNKEEYKLIEILKEFVFENRGCKYYDDEFIEYNTKNESIFENFNNNEHLESIHINDPIDFLEHYIELLETNMSN